MDCSRAKTFVLAVFVSTSEVGLRSKFRGAVIGSFATRRDDSDRSLRLGSGHLRVTDDSVARERRRLGRTGGAGQAGGLAAVPTRAWARD